MVVASRRAEALAAEFRRENEALIALVTGMDEHDWTADCPREGRAGVVVGHIAEDHLIIGEIVRIYAAALERHQQHLEDACDRRAWHVLARHLVERAVWSANSTEEAVRDGRPLPFNPNIFNQHDH